MTARVWLVLLAVLALVASACGGSTSDDTVADGELYRFVIPAGTGERIDAGEPVEIVPAQLNIEVGDTVEIENLDTRGHNVGPFFVGEDETVRQTFRSAAVYTDSCSVHPSGEFTIVVS
jgi:plastocyanin